MLDFLEDWKVGADWLNFGGGDTARSYGVAPPLAPDFVSLIDLQKAIGQAVPAAHWAFFRDCRMSHVEGDYLFVHAGIRPGVAWDQQVPQDLLWIRDTFLRSRADHGKMVVHGHSISESVEFRPNRIGIDTGAFFSGVLTCLVLEGAEVRLIQT
jgi:serine/threonine protein phosphatase 1